MTPYFIQAEAFNGDADGPANMDLFVVGPSVDLAIVVWRGHFIGWDMPDEIKVYTLPTQWPDAAGVVQWASLPFVKRKL